MPIELQDKTVWQIGEALKEVGLSRSTYFRWVKAGRVPDVVFRDRNGRRVFTREEIEQLKSVAQQLLNPNPQTLLTFGV